MNNDEEIKRKLDKKIQQELKIYITIICKNYYNIVKCIIKIG